MLLKTRIDRPELMDTLVLSRKDMKETLGFLQRTNSHFGGINLVLARFDEWSKKWPRDTTVSVLDVGTGAGDIPLALNKWALKNTLAMEITGVDIIPEIISIARENTKNTAGIKIEQVNVESLAWTGKQYDVVIGSLFLHHVALKKQLQMLGIFDQLARRAVLISDLLRSVPSYLAVSAATNLFGNRIARHDGPLSVRRAFTVGELNDLAQRAGLPYLKARREPWFRVSLSGEKPLAAA